MTKIIHCIKVGPNSELGDFELSCIDSWKRVYPDFEIKYWADKEIISLISDCKYAISCYNNRKFAYVSDYARLKILYENGGWYMDTDVFCVDRIPDEYFEKSFTSWDAGFDTYWTQSGTCLYAANPNEELFKKFVDFYKSFGEYPEFKADNTIIEYVIRNIGLDFSDRTTCQFTNQNLKELQVFNCIQFGAFDYSQNLMWTTGGAPVFLVHSRTRSWAGYDNENVYLYYAFIDDNTDVMKLYNAVHRFNDMSMNNLSCNAVLVLGMNTVSGIGNWFSKWLKLNVTDPKKHYMMVPLGNNLGEDELNAAFLDFITKRFNKIKFCRDIMNGEFTGTLEV